MGSVFARYINWGPWGSRRTADESTPTGPGKSLSRLIPKVFLKLYKVFPSHGPQHSNVLPRILAASKVVSRRGNKIAMSSEGRSIAVNLQDGRERIQESDLVQYPKNYTRTLAKWRLRFLLEFMPGIILGINRSWNKWDGQWEYEKQTVIQSTLVACCLVSRE